MANPKPNQNPNTNPNPNPNPNTDPNTNPNPNHIHTYIYTAIYVRRVAEIVYLCLFRLVCTHALAFCTAGEHVLTQFSDVM